MDTLPDLRPTFDRATAQMAELIAAVGPDRFAAPTPCEDYDVRGLLTHIVDGTLRAAQAGEDGRVTGPAHVGEIADDAWPATYAHARDRARAAWAGGERLDTVVSVPWGDVPGRMAVAGFVMETVTHTWDLARAIGDGRRLDEDLAAAALETAHRAVPEEREGIPFAPAHAVPEGADTYQRLVAWLGRRPEWTAA